MDTVVEANEAADYYRRVKDIIKLAGPRFVSVTFVKKDRSIRKMTIHPRYFAYIKGPPEPQAVITRRENNRNLYNCYDVVKRAPRCFDMDALVSLRVNRKTYARQGMTLVEVQPGEA